MSFDREMNLKSLRRSKQQKVARTASHRHLTICSLKSATDSHQMLNHHWFLFVVTHTKDFLLTQMLSNTGTCTDSSPTVSLELVRTFLLNFPCSFYFLSILSLLHIGLFPVGSCCPSRYFPQLCPINAHRSISRVLSSPNFFPLRSCVSISMNFPTYAHTSARAHLACGERPALEGAQRGPTSPSPGVIRSTLLV